MLRKIVLGAKSKKHHLFHFTGNRNWVNYFNSFSNVKSKK